MFIFFYTSNQLELLFTDWPLKMINAIHSENNRLWLPALCVWVRVYVFKTAQELCLYDSLLIMLDLLLYTYIEN